MPPKQDPKKPKSTKPTTTTKGTKGGGTKVVNLDNEWLWTSR
jgi:hypothetical protein